MSGATFNPRIRRYPAPDSLPTGTICRQILIPDDPGIIAAVNDVIAYLTLQGVWEPSANVTEPEMQALLSQMWYDFGESDCGE